MVKTLEKINRTSINLNAAVNLALENDTIAHEARATLEAAVGNLRV